ncbi:hypothetical protein [Peptostreptococcus anaerobius]|uniref:hypothetical protein n=1 Tax=Peptostreptococcus anaerobius TaxID=1261 RepID=UPI00242C187F|nr:hypothetical protein [Peptostreptococcus anaerobius]
MRKESKFEKLYYYFTKEENKNKTNDDVWRELDIQPDVVKTYLSRLRAQGLVSITTEDGNRVVKVLDDFKPNNYRPKNYKQSVLYTMCQALVEDFEEADNFNDHLRIMREIRLILKEM